MDLSQKVSSFQSEDEIYSSKYYYKGCIVIPVHASANTHYQLSNKKRISEIRQQMSSLELIHTSNRFKKIKCPKWLDWKELEIERKFGITSNVNDHNGKFSKI